MLSQVLTQLGTTAFVIAIAGWLLRTSIYHHLERLHTKHAHDLGLRLEAARARWAQDLARLNVHETYLHTRRVTLIEDMHKEAVEAEFSLQNFLVSWWARTNKAELLSRGLVPTGHFEDGHDDRMETRGGEFCERYLQINATLHRNAIFFDDDFLTGVRAAYEPFFNLIINLDYGAVPVLPEEYKNIVEAGREPRRAVVALFRRMLGVCAGDAHGEAS